MSELKKQSHLEFEKVPIKVGDKLKINRQKDKYAISFINEFGFETEALPEKSVIKIEPYLVAGSIVMPETKGQIFYQDGAPYYHIFLNNVLSDGKHALSYRLQGEEIIEILELPKTE